MRKLVGSCSLLIAASMLAACGGGSSNAQHTSTQPTSVIGSASSRDLAKLVADADKQRFEITYTNAAGDKAVYAQDGNGTTMIANDNAQTFSTKTSTISCDKNSGQYACSETPGSLSVSANPFLGVLTLEQSQLNSLGADNGRRSSTIIAGRDAQCVTFLQSDLGPSDGTVSAQASAGKATYTYCIDKDTGATLEVATTDDAGKQSSVLRVTKFATPRASDFTPPAAPTSITIPGGG